MATRVPRHHRLPARAVCRFPLIALGTALALGACTRDQVAYNSGLPGASSSATLEFLGEHDGYLDVEIETAGKTLRFFLDAADADCAALRDAAGDVAYVNSGALGRLDRGSLRCEPVGLLSLVEWRNRMPRPSGPPLPRAAANWSVIHRDSELVLARGRFVLAREIGWVGGIDSVAVFAVDPKCEAIIESGVGSLEYRSGGQEVLVIIGKDQRCPLLGIARPLSNRR